MDLSLGEVERATGGSITSTDPIRDLAIRRAEIVRGWSIDSRTVARGDLFFAIKGDRFDGHEFLREVFAAGARGAVVSEPVPNQPGTVLTVQDPVKALGDIARITRARWNKRVVAITGSAGKTSTKEIVAALLATRFRIGKTVGNLNNHLGLPLTFLRLPENAEVAVLEMGMNHAGEIRYLAKIACPQIGVVTNVGYAHIEAFSSIEGVAAAKRELIEELPPDGVAVLNADDARVAGFGSSCRGRVLTFGFGAGAQIRAERFESGPEGSAFFVNGTRFETRLAGEHAIRNILAALAVASIFEISPGDLVNAVAQLAPGTMRGTRRQIRGALVIDDSYNSNPEAARSMLDVLARATGKRRIAVFGEMLELGAWSESLHRELGRVAAAHSVDVLIGVGGASRFMVKDAVGAGFDPGAAFFFDDAEQAGEFLRGFVRPGDAVLFKGSRGTHVERAIARMEE